jgi:MoaA/NifB/PqqE/SkfB family radical SAM enzyme
MSYFNLEQKFNFAKSFIFKKSPLYVQFYITARCNLACEQCNIIYSDAKHQEMHIEQIQKVAKI